MTETSPRPLALSRKVLSIVIGLNLLMGFVVAALLVSSIVAETFTFTALGVSPRGMSGGLLAGMRIIMVVGIAAVPLAHVVLTRLRTIVDTVSLGDPFVAENARRLETIAWSILGLEALHVVVGIVAANASTEAQPLDLDWSFSVTRWLAVLLLFVLARVFDQGARMREDLEGTI